MLFYMGIEVPSLNCVQCGEVLYLKRAPSQRDPRWTSGASEIAGALPRLAESA
jgi:hypothetical protein